MQVAETVQDEPRESGEPTASFLTAVVTQDAPASDKAGMAKAFAEQQRLGLEPPATLYVDGAYVSSEALLQARDEQRELRGPAPASPDRGKVFTVGALSTDPIIAEVRAAGEELARRAGFDLDRLCDMLREPQRQRGIRGVDRSGQRLRHYPTVSPEKTLSLPRAIREMSTPSQEVGGQVQGRLRRTGTPPVWRPAGQQDYGSDPAASRRCRIESHGVTSAVRGRGSSAGASPSKSASSSNSAGASPSKSVSSSPSIRSKRRWLAEPKADVTRLEAEQPRRGEGRLCGRFAAGDVRGVCRPHRRTCGRLLPATSAAAPRVSPPCRRRGGSYGLALAIKPRGKRLPYRSVGDPEAA